MTQLAAVDVALQQDGNVLAEPRLERGICVDVDLDHGRSRLRSERRKRRAHVVAEVTVRADEKREPDG